MSKIAVVLFNLGGPDRLESIEPFLFNLFNDPAIIGAPKLVRRLLAKWISRKRAPLARKIYSKIGGKSPLVELTRRQADALEDRLSGPDEVRAFVCMRYWHPMSGETVAEVAAFDPEEIVLLPLYPQFSITTSGSSLEDWRRAAAEAGLHVPTKEICCYPTEPGFIETVAKSVRDGIARSEGNENPRILFSAHGLPKRVIERGDPYQWQVERTVEAVVKVLSISDLDWSICYQSRVGPMKWIGPSILEELQRAANDKKPVVIVPIAFVSEHSETLVELDIKYRDESRKQGVPGYVRVPTAGTAQEFISGLANLVTNARLSDDKLFPGSGARSCPAACGCCPKAE